MVASVLVHLLAVRVDVGKDAAQKTIVDVLLLVAIVAD